MLMCMFNIKLFVRILQVLSIVYASLGALVFAVVSCTPHDVHYSIPLVLDIVSRTKKTPLYMLREEARTQREMC